MVSAQNGEAGGAHQMEDSGGKRCFVISTKQIQYYTV